MLLFISSALWILFLHFNFWMLTYLVNKRLWIVISEDPLNSVLQAPPSSFWPPSTCKKHGYNNCSKWNVQCRVLIAVYVIIRWPLSFWNPLKMFQSWHYKVLCTSFHSCRSGNLVEGNPGVTSGDETVHINLNLSIGCLISFGFGHIHFEVVY